MAVKPISFTEKGLVKSLPALLKVWPTEGFKSLRVAHRILGDLVESTGELVVAHDTPRIALQQKGVRVAVNYASPWKYQKYFQKDKNIRQSAMKVRPGAEIPITLNGVATTAFVNTARRLTFRGSKNYVKMDVNINTENIALILERETKCSCVYCGTSPTTDEVSCRACGAPLPDC